MKKINIYSSYKCKNCNKEFVLLIEDIECHIRKNRYLVCPYCSSEKIHKQKATDNLKECMDERSYKRIHGAIRQKI